MACTRASWTRDSILDPSHSFGQVGTEGGFVQVPGVSAGEVQGALVENPEVGGSTISHLLGMRVLGWMTQWLGIAPCSRSNCRGSIPETLWGAAHVSPPLPPPAPPHWPGLERAAEDPGSSGLTLLLQSPPRLSRPSLAGGGPEARTATLGLAGLAGAL